MKPAIETVYRTDNESGSAYVVAFPLNEPRRRFRTPWDYSLGQWGNHREAAKEVAQRLGLHGQWIAGDASEHGYVFVCLVGAPSLGDGAAFTVEREGDGVENDKLRRLFDAAPDMLEALKMPGEALATLAGHGKPLPPYKGEQYIRAQSEIRAAITKAEGRPDDA